MELVLQHEENDAVTAREPQEERWEHAEFSADFTPHTSRRIDLYYSQLSPRSKIRAGETESQPTAIDIRSVDTTNMTLLDVCNYMPEPNVDGSGHCVWLGALYLSHALSIGMAFSEMTKEKENLKSINNNGWYNDDYFGGNNTVVELGCGTGAAGIALLKLLSLRSAAIVDSASTTTSVLLPREFQFWDNDPEALDLCRENVKTNIPFMAVNYQMDPGWMLNSDFERLLANNSTGQTSSVDTIIATDVLYDLKIIRLFLETAARMLSHNTCDTGNVTTDSTRMKHLILSHVPRWFLPRDDNDAIAGNKSTTEKDRAQALEDHIVKEAAECGFSLKCTVRPKDVLGQYQVLVSCKEAEDESTKELDDPPKEALEQVLGEMDQTRAVLWVLVFDKQ